jgi:hypothetical protein
MLNRKTVLFMTNEEFGQTNVVLAVVYELLRQNQLDIHIASWAALEPRVAALSEKVGREMPDITLQPVQFHTLPFSPMFSMWEKNGGSMASIPHPPGRKGMARLQPLVAELFGVWGPKEYVELCEACENLAKKLQPGLIILDPVFPPAHDMCRKLNWNHAVLTPCTLASGLIPGQPWLAGIWKYPRFV